MTTKPQAAAWLRRLPEVVETDATLGRSETFISACNRIADLLDPPTNRPDQRTSPRLIRIRLYRRGAEEPAADSEMQGDHTAPPDAPGSWVVHGLPEVAHALATTAAAFHTNDPITGLDRATLLHRIKALRPTLSRNGGTAVWRVPYAVDGANWDARVDVVNA